MSKATPGPWRANFHHTQDFAGRTHAFIHANTAVPIAAVVLGAEGCSQDEGRANARLIAAAPDLFAALDRIMGMGAPIGMEPAWEAARAALSKASAP